MKKILSILGVVAIMFGSVAVTTQSVEAQNRGGKVRRGGASKLIFDNCPARNGRVPSGAGNLTITTYVTSVDLNVHCSNIDLPDGTVLTVTVYANDWFTGQPWAPRQAGTITVASRKGQLQSLGVYQTAIGAVPIVKSIVVTAPDGTFIMSGHP